VIPNGPAHRRAIAFAQALDERDGRDLGPDQGLLTLTQGLEELPRPELDPEVKVVQRAQLVAAFEAMLHEGADTALPEQRTHRSRGAHRASPLSKLRPRTRLTKGLAAGGLSVGVAAGALGGVAAASTDALPGDSLYGLKRGIEDFKLNYLADGDDERGKAYLDQASTRLNEARRLMDRDRGGSLDHESLGEIRRALSGMTHDASEGHKLLRSVYESDPDSLEPLKALEAFNRSHREVWAGLRERLPVQLGDVSEQVTSVFDAIEQEIAPLQKLVPKAPDTAAEDGKSTGSTAPSDDTAPAPGRTAAPSSETGGAGEDSGGQGAGKARPSADATSGSSDEGLLGGAGGLLNPPQDTGDSTSAPSGGTATTRPDITLPPLLPGLLPGLGIDAQDAD
jgi:hypothetical protein